MGIYINGKEAITKDDLVLATTGDIQKLQNQIDAQKQNELNLTNLFSKAEYLTNADDANNVTDSLVISLGSSAKNLPEKTTWGILVTFALNPANRIQVCLNVANSMYIRSYSGMGPSWSAWKQIGGVARRLYNRFSSSLATSRMEVA